jgi:hypothetical protein
METKVTISINVAAPDAKEVLDFIMSHANFADFDLRVSSSAGDAVPPVSPGGRAEDSNSNYLVTTAPNSLRHFLRDTDQKVVKFVVDHDGEFLNADLAKKLGVDTPLTCFPLGRITRKLQKVGVKVEGARGENWYTKHKTTRGTLLKVRADVLAKFREALHD